MSAVQTVTASPDQEISIPSAPLDDPACWMGKELQHSVEWQYRLTPSDLAELDAALAKVRGNGLDLVEITKQDFPLPTLSARLLKLRRDVLDGRGFVLLRGIPVDRYSRDDVAALYWGMGVHMGYPVSQNGKGHLLGHVTDLGEKSAPAPEEAADKLRVFRHPVLRGYNSRGRAYFHVDVSDIVGLLCLHPAKSGGQSLIVSSIAIHNEILRRRPDLLKVLYQPFWTSRQNEIPVGAKPYFQMPMFSFHAGKLTTYLTPGFIRNCEIFPELPPLTEDQLAALDLVEEIANDPAFHLSMMLEKGDMQLLHNHVTLHTRSEYEDFDEVDRRRHLIRLWLVTPENRPLPHWNYDCNGGGRRGGIYVPGVKEVASLDP